jgi:hypothetical protein
MKKAASNGRGQNVKDITAPHVGARFSEAHSVAESAKARWPMNWTDLCKLILMPAKRANGSTNDFWVAG